MDVINQTTPFFTILLKNITRFLTRIGQQDKSLPKHVGSEFEEYLKNSRLE